MCALVSSHERLPPLQTPTSTPSRDGAPRPKRMVVPLVAAGLIGGLASVGILQVTGALGDSTPAHQPATASTAAATVTPATAEAAGSGATTRLNAGAVYAAASPGVVDITSTSRATDAGPFGGQEGAGTSTGTGFVVNADGRIVTAAHVVEGATKVTVTFSDGTTRTATVLGVDNATDLAVIKVDPSGLTLHPLRLGSSAALSVGAEVAAIGDPFGYKRSISTGIVAGLDRTVAAPNGYTVAHAIQTDAALNPGNSGGPLLDAAGNVVGVVDQIATGGGAKQNSGVGFAIPIDLVARELDTLSAGHEVRHAYIGVATSDASGATAGALVGDVAAGSPAASAGIRAGDVITSADGKTVKGASDLVAAIAAHAPGDKTQVTVLRGGGAKTFTVTLGTQPSTRTGG